MNAPPMVVATAGLPSVRDYSHWRAVMGIPQDGSYVPADLRAFARTPADEAWVYTCMWIKAAAAQSVPLRVQVRSGSGWDDIAGTSDGAGEDLQHLLDDVNPAWDGSQLQAYTSAGGSIHGGSYWRKVRGRLGGAPQELYWLSGALIEPKVGRSFPEAYEYRPGGQVAEVYPTSEVIAFRDTINLEDPYRLLSPLSAARYEVSTSKQAAEWNDALLRNWGIPAGAWRVAQGAEITATDKSFIRRALRALRGPGNQGKQPILPTGLEWQQLSMSQRDADWIATRKVSRMTICAVQGVPLVLAGDDEKSSVYANLRDAERVFWRRTMISELDQRATRINSWLVPDFDPTRRRLRVAYDYSGIEALRGAPTEEMSQWAQAVKLGVPLNRYIEHFGMGEKVDGGDEPRVYLTTGPLQLDDVEEVPRPAEYQTAGQTGGDVPERVRSLGRRLYRDARVRAYLASGDEADLADLAEPSTVPLLTAGLRRRDAAAVIAASMEGQNDALRR